MFFAAHCYFPILAFLANYFYRFNVRRPPLDDIRVRQALAMAIDRESLVNKYLRRTQKSTTSLVPEGIPGYISAPGLEYNPKRAKELLAEAGFSDPTSFPKLEILYNTDAQHKTVALVIQQMWKQNLGVTATLVNEEWKSYLKTQALGDYLVSRSGWVGDYVDPNTFLEMFRTDSTVNLTGWSSKEYDQLLDRSMVEDDPVARAKLMQQAEALLLKEAPVVPLFTAKKHMLVRPYVRGFYPNLQDIHPMKGVTIDETITEQAK